MNIYLLIVTLLFSGHAFGSEHQAKRPAPDPTENSYQNSLDFFDNLNSSRSLSILPAAAAAHLNGVNWNPNSSTNPEDFSCIFCTSTSGCDCANQLAAAATLISPDTINSYNINKDLDVIVNAILNNSSDVAAPDTNSTIENLASRENEPEEDSGTHQCRWGNCGEIFNSNQALYDHVKEHACKTERNYLGNRYCRWQNCTEICTTPSNLKKHIIKHFSRKSDKCNLKNNKHHLSTLGTTKNDQPNNLLDVSGTPKDIPIKNTLLQPFQPILAATATDDAKIKDLTSRENEEEEVTHLCLWKECGQTVYGDKAFYAHVKKHANNVQEIEKELPCGWENCSKSFSRKDGLRIHSRKHSGYKPLQCKTCFIRFHEYHNLKNHEKKHHKLPAAACAAITTVTENNDQDEA